MERKRKWVRVKSGHDAGNGWGWIAGGLKRVMFISEHEVSGDYVWEHQYLRLYRTIEVEGFLDILMDAFPKGKYFIENNFIVGGETVFSNCRLLKQWKPYVSFRLFGMSLYWMRSYTNIYFTTQVQDCNCVGIGERFCWVFWKPVNLGNFF